MKSIMKKATSILLIVTMIVAYMPVMSFAETDVQSSGTCGTSVSWNLADNGTLIISGSGKMSNYEDETKVPWYSVRDSIETVVINDGVQSICSNAFYGCSNLTGITIPEGVGTIDMYVFAGCSSLSSVSIPDSVTRIEPYAFYQCSSLTDIEIPENVIYIGQYAFSECTGLTGINIPGKMTEITEYTFAGCSSLTDITISEGVKYIYDGAFEGCSSLSNVTLPASIQQIWSDAFSDCGSLKYVFYAGTEYEWGQIDIRSNNSSIEQASKHYSAADHTWSTTWTIDKAPTCTEEGSKSMYCLYCDKTKDKTSIPMTDHDTTKHSAKAPTCTEAGYEAYESCKNCDYTTYKVIPEAGHTPSAEATCTEPQKCTVCDEVLVKAKGHTPAIGTTPLKCAVCDEVLEAVESGTCGDNLSWTLSDDGLLCIYGEGEMSDFAREEDAPWYSFKDSIKTVTITEGVTSVGENAFFYYSNLKVVNIQCTMCTIGASAFYSCPITDTCYIGTEPMWPEMVTIGSNNNKLKNPARFHYECSGCDLTESRVDPTCTKDGSSTISCKNCSYSKTEILTDGHEFKDGYCTKCGEREVIASENGSDWSWVLYGDGVLEISGTGTIYRRWESSLIDSIKKVVINSGINGIGSMAFYGCTNLTEISIPSTVTVLEQSAFSSCNKLKSITIPDSVTSIGIGAFTACNNLTSITIPDSVTSIENNTFSGCFNLISITIPDSVTSIGNYAFSYCSGLTRILIPDSVTSIGKGAFKGCSGLTSITIPEGVTSIGEDAFNDCRGLTSITIPEGVTSIGDRAFYDCGGLTSITIPEGVISIGDRAFSGCWSLTSIMIPEGVTTIGENLFSGCSSLTSITIPEGVTSIGNSAFSGCWRLTSITIPEGVTSIGEDAFSSCSSLTSITIPESVTFLGDSVFCGCSGVTSITIPGSVISIGENAFYDCDGLTSVTIRDGISSIGICAFYSCSGLTSISIPNSVTSIGNSAFLDCNDLTSVTLPASLKTVGASAFTHHVRYIFYTGSESDWNQIEFGNSDFISADSYIHYNSTNHTWDDNWTTDKAATCTEEGSKSHHCIYCDERQNVTTIPVTEHDLLQHQAKDATCTADGNKEYFTCSICNKVFKDKDGASETTIQDEVIQAKGHTPGDEATCTEPQKCTVCDEVLTEAKGHTPGDEATCTEPQKCTVCDEILVEALGHDIVQHESKAATCTEAGNKAYETCTRCDYTTFEEIKAIGHSLTKIDATSATCTTDGNNAYFVCSDCHKTYKDAEGKTETTAEVEVIPATGHTPGPEATCTEPRKCTVCDEILVKALGHDIVQHEGKAATCTEAGNKAYVTCTRCDYTTFEEIKAIGHSWSNWTVSKPPTCVDGQRYRICNVCGEFETAIIPATGHSLTKIDATSATCTTDGNNAHFVCSDCHKAYKDAEGKTETTAEVEVIPAAGHTPGTEATCTEPQKCTVCGEILVNATGHTYKDVVTRATLSSNGRIVIKCSKCSEVKSTTTIYRPTKFTLSTTAYTYDGGIKKPTVTVKNSAGKTLAKDTDYTLTYASGRKYVGKYSVKINFKGKYSGSKTLYFNINPPKTSLTSLTASSKGFTAKWSKKTTQVTGYQIQYSTSSKFTNPKTVTITKNSTTYKKITKLTAKKRYYVRVRTYKTVGSTKYYSSWSSYKSVITRS
ncbi:MAG: leucine-rich repeat protein [Eubacteriaceae bacterium]|nr:leucine-rich repeat protein [Eubacteriaceae bacterium]